MILIKVDKENKQPLFQQVFEQLKQLIETGDLLPGENLPSTRKLAETLGVHRATVYRAYEELWAAGYLEATAGAYSRVRQRNTLAIHDSEPEHSIINWENHFSDAVNRIAQIPSTTINLSNDILDFAPLSPDSDLLPVDDFRHCLNQVLQSEGASLLQYGNPLGYEPLREYLARQMRQHGIATKTDEIMLTNGMQNGIELVFRLMTNPGDCIITERPSYASALSLIKYLDLQVIGIPMTNDGMDLDILEQQLQTHRPRLIYSMPTFQNPTGISTSQTHRENLLALCEKYQVPLIEDGFEEEMKYFGKAVLPIKSMDKHHLVIYLGTFSKVLFPGIRVGWIVAPNQLISRLGKMKRVTELSGSPLTQAAVYQFCKQGFYELHKKRLHRIYRKRMQQALQACREFLPANQIHYTKPDGGYLMWFTLKDTKLQEEEFINQLTEAGINVSPGSRFFPEPNNEVHFRLSIAHRNENEIKEGIRRIGQILKKINRSKE
jgi:DNA-binding transcriptional MocR family regulator